MPINNQSAQGVYQDFGNNGMLQSSYGNQGYYGNYGVKYDQNDGGSVWVVNDNLEHVQDFEPPPNYSSQMHYPNLEEETKKNEIILVFMYDGSTLDIHFSSNHNIHKSS